MPRRTVGSIFVLLLLVAPLAPLRAEIVDRIVAVVGGRVITWSDLAREARYQAFLKGQPQPSWEQLQSKVMVQPILSRLMDQSLLQQARSAFPFLLTTSSFTIFRSSAVIAVRFNRNERNSCV